MPRDGRGLRSKRFVQPRSTARAVSGNSHIPVTTAVTTFSAPRATGNDYNVRGERFSMKRCTIASVVLSTNAGSETSLPGR